MAVLCALAYVVMLVIKIPMVEFLSYEPKDIVITIGGFMFGPLSAVIISVIWTASSIPQFLAGRSFLILSIQSVRG